MATTVKDERYYRRVYDSCKNISVIIDDLINEVSRLMDEDKTFGSKDEKEFLEIARGLCRIDKYKELLGRAIIERGSSHSRFSYKWFNGIDFTLYEDTMKVYKRRYKGSVSGSSSPTTGKQPMKNVYVVEDEKDIQRLERLGKLAKEFRLLLAPAYKGHAFMISVDNYRFVVNPLFVEYLDTKSREKVMLVTRTGDVDSFEDMKKVLLQSLKKRKIDTSVSAKLLKFYFTALDLRIKNV